MPSHLCHEDALHSHVVLKVLVHVQHQDGCTPCIRKVDPAGGRGREGLNTPNNHPQNKSATPQLGMDGDSLCGLVHQPVLVLGMELLQVPELDPALLAPCPSPQPLQACLGENSRDRRITG